MIRRTFGKAAVAAAACGIAFTSAQASAAAGNGIVKGKSAYTMQDTISRITDDIAAKKIKLFDVIDQAKLGKDAGVELNPSTLIVFGNPPLGTQFLTSNPDSGLDWPVRLLVYQDKDGQVWTAYTDFTWIAQRHGNSDRAAQFKTASEVIALIVSSVATH